MNPLGLRVAMLLALRFFLVLLFLRQTRIEIDLGEFVNQIRQHKCVRIIRIQKDAALLGEIGFVRFFVDGEEKFLLHREQFLLTRVLVKGKLSFINGTPLVRILHHAQELFIARLTELHFEHETPADLDIALFEFFHRFARQAVDGWKWWPAR